MANYGTLPLIGYNNLLVDGTTSGDGTNPENAYDWLTYDYWTTGAASGYIETTFGGAQTADYFAFALHDLYTQSASIKLQYWTGAAYADITETVVTPANNTAQFIPFPQKSATKYKVVVTTGGAAAYIGAVAFGDRLQLSRGCQPGYIPPELSYRDEILNNKSQGGQLLGRSILHTGIAGAIQLNDMTDEWAHVHFDPFVSHARRYAWFLLWSPDARPDDAAVCWTTKPIEPKYSRVGFVSAQVNYEGRTS